MFKITGIFQGRTATVKWRRRAIREGILTGDQDVIEKAKYENTQDHGYLGPVPADVNKNYLSYELAAYCLLEKYVFDSVISEENDWPPYDSDVTY